MTSIDVAIVLGALGFLMLAAYRGFSVILFAPLAASLAVLCTDPAAIFPVFSGVFMEKAAVFLKLYLPVFVLSAVFGKLIEVSGFSQSIANWVVERLGAQRAMESIVMVCAILTYGGVSLFVVVFAVYPFAAEMFRRAEIPRRLIPGTIALGAFTFTMDALPGSPQIQNIIPTTFFGTTAWAAPWLGVVGSIFILFFGLLYLRSRRNRAVIDGESYTSSPGSGSDPAVQIPMRSPLVAVLPLLVVGVTNFALTRGIPFIYASLHETRILGSSTTVLTKLDQVAAIWALEGALILGILTVLTCAYRAIAKAFISTSTTAISGALLASMNTAAEYGFGSVIALLPGFTAIRDMLQTIPHPLVKEAITVTTLAGMTGSASGGLSIALASMAGEFMSSAEAAGISTEVLHRIASMASGGMDTLPHNGAVITLLAVTGLTHRQAYRDIFAITIIKTAAVFLVIAVHAFTGVV